MAFLAGCQQLDAVVAIEGGSVSGVVHVAVRPEEAAGTAVGSWHRGWVKAMNPTTHARPWMGRFAK